jgi:hypothetical protein
MLTGLFSRRVPYCEARALQVQDSTTDSQSRRDDPFGGGEAE